MSEPTERHEPHTPAFGSGQDGGNENPWQLALAVPGLFALIAGIIAYAAGYDDATSTSVLADGPASGIAAMFAGQMLIVAGIVLLAGWLIAGAVCWQLRRREQ